MNCFSAKSRKVREILPKQLAVKWAAFNESKVTFMNRFQQQNGYQSIALKKLYKFTFGCKLIWGSVRPQIRKPRSTAPRRCIQKKWLFDANLLWRRVSSETAVSVCVARAVFVICQRTPGKQDAGHETIGKRRRNETDAAHWSDVGVHYEQRAGP